MTEVVPPSHSVLGDETFMSAEALRTYMRSLEQTRLQKELAAQEREEQVRAELVESLSQPISLPPQRLKEIIQGYAIKMRHAAQRGESELMVMRFPNALCADRGRAINNVEPGWPETLVGRPRQAYELWRDHLRPLGFKIKAQIVDWPNGMPGDVGLFLSWA